MKYTSTFQPQIGLKMKYLQIVMNHSYGPEKYCKWKIVYNNFECLLYLSSLPFMTWCCLQEQMMLVKTPWK